MSTNPIGSSNSPSLNNSSDTLTTRQKINKRVENIKDTMSSAASNVSEWTPVKTVRNSAPWYYLTWPFSALGSFLGAIWARISKAVWGSHSIVTEEITLESKGYIWNSTYKISTEEALRKSLISIESLEKEGKLTMEDAKIRGWIPVTIPGRWYGSSTMLLKDAIEGGYMTVEKAIEAELITESQANQATWIQKKTT